MLDSADKSNLANSNSEKQQQLIKKQFEGEEF